MKKYVIYHPIADDIFVSISPVFYFLYNNTMYEIEAICEL